MSYLPIESGRNSLTRWCRINWFNRSKEDEGASGGPENVLFERRDVE